MIVEKLKDAYGLGRIQINNLVVMVRDHNGDIEEANKTLTSIADHLAGVSEDFGHWKSKGKPLGG